MVIDTNGLFNDLSKKFNAELEVVESLSVISENISELEDMLENFDKIEKSDYSVKNLNENFSEYSEDDFDEDFDDDFDESELYESELEDDDLDDLEEFYDDGLDEKDFDAKSVPQIQSIEKILEMI